MISLLGYVINKEGVLMGQDKVTAVTNWPIPTTVKEQQRFLEFTNFYLHSRLTTFHLIPATVNQTEARAACRENYIDLVTLYSDEDNTELDNSSYGWIGLYRGQFSEKWSNGDPVTFRNLTGDCGTSSCCAAMKPDGSWESAQCTGTRYFMCYEQAASSQTPNYHLIRENKTWYEAQRYCRGNYTDLVSIRDQQQNEEVKIKGLNSSTSFWIGLLRDDWQWTDGGNSTYRNWASGHPLSSPYNCVRAWLGKWISEPCSSNYPPLCYGKWRLLSGPLSETCH
ncbi:macrophage mannose receptor 1-like [Pangasianodon hypophthalmus]|uniref:macrophage mannose receptor 1-like n=1 Tax=Pangasianodon hypophthalmus TaxID=310915 RepID=UPI0023077BAA|nr:macrophage mannose receptor 1-like [Pangasianodon hypophthalmus]